MGREGEGAVVVFGDFFLFERENFPTFLFREREREVEGEGEGKGEGVGGGGGSGSSPMMF